jgi:membrane peptidoglycan carboxypeptidase
MKHRKIGLLSFVLLIVAGVVGWLWLFGDLPALDSLPARLHTPSVRIVDRNGRLLYEALDEQGGRHAVVPLEAIPLACRQAAIATEDRRFYSHPGVDLQGILRAAWINLRGGEALAGGSTITQQVARNLLLDQAERGERSLRRKLREALLAWRLTRHFTKDEILALYLNQTYYGGMAYGLEAAAQTFFGRPAAQLDLAECALLAGLPQAPALYNPYTNLEAARARQSIVLRLMEQDGYITAEQRRLAEREPLALAEKPYPIEAPHFVMMVRAELDRQFSPEQIYQRGGLVVRTTLDLDWQKLAEAAVARHLEQLQRSEDGLGHNVHNAALVALHPRSGEVLALVGSPDYFDGAHGGAINMALAPRQPGSAIKPLVYAAALDPTAPGGGWTAATMLLDVSTSFTTSEGKAYIPANYDLREHGPVLLPSSSPWE